MPLKHDTETGLIVLLGFAIAVSGIVCAFLPPLSLSVWPWAIAFAISIAYPLLLYPLFRSRRADVPFRLIHFAPAIILLLWLVSELLASAFPSLQFLQTGFTFGSSILAVFFFVILLIAFCVQVIRQRTRRIGLLLLLMIPFTVAAFWSEQGDWDRLITARLWDSALADLVSGGGATGNLLPSTDSAEEQWRIELRLMEQRRQQLLARQTGSIIVSVNAPVLGAQISADGLSPQTGTGDIIPPHLPSSGMGTEAVAVVFLAMASATIHRRTVTRGRGRIA